MTDPRGRPPLGLRAAVALAALLLVPGLAGAGPVGDRLEDARQDRDRAREQATSASAGLEDLSSRYERAAAGAKRAAAELIDAYRAEGELRARLAEARTLLDERAAAAYRAGPGASLNALLDSDDLGDLSARSILLHRVLLAGVENAADVLEERSEASAIRRDLARARAELAARQRRLAALRVELEDRLASAEAAALRAGRRVRSLERERRELAEARRRERTFRTLVDPGTGQAELLAMLGPTGGRGCRIPPALRRTGRVLRGLASWYGQEFAGGPTASGAVFIPELFTAAHKTLPLPSFLHVRYNGRCATVLVNDRGPYIEGRFLDLSEGAAAYLGLVGPGVDQVTAEILSPA